MTRRPFWVRIGHAHSRAMHRAIRRHRARIEAQMRRLRWSAMGDDFIENPPATYLAPSHIVYACFLSGLGEVLDSRHHRERPTGTSTT